MKAAILLVVVCITCLVLSAPTATKHHVVMYSEMAGGENHTLTAAPGDGILLNIPNFATTGYTWYLESINPASLAKYVGNETGGGVTGPPYINVSFTAGSAGKGVLAVEVHTHYLL